jgi:hypothetical protein
MSEPEIRIHEATDCLCNNDHPELDQFIAQNVNVHFEMMGGAQFWIGITDPATGRMWHINCGAVNSRVKGYSRCEEDSLPSPVAAEVV